jgi:hypothetical protein
MGNVKVRVTNAVVDGNAHGSVIEINEKSAKHLVSLGYVELVAEVSKPKAKAESAPTDADKPAEKPKPQRKSTKDSK